MQINTLKRPDNRLLLLLLFYFVIHLTNLTILPIFNDESIYLDWAWSHTHMPGHLFDALLDAKQPLMIWLFAISQNIFPDPLFAGRFVNVLIGSLTLLGIYRIALRIFNKHIALFAAIIYSITPIFVFYNRQALLDAGIACVGIWSAYALLSLLQHPTRKSGILLGAILGIGYLIKSSSLLFIISSTLIVTIYIIRTKSKRLFISSLTSIVAFIAIDLIILISPVFWQTLPSNSRYSHTLSELLTFPLNVWGSNLAGFLEIAILYITPLTFIASLIGMLLLWKTRPSYFRAFLTFFLVALALEMLIAKSQTHRYIVPFLSFLVIPASYVLSLLWKRTYWEKAVVILCLICPLALTLLLITAPEQYISKLSTISSYSENGYISGQTSGYGINEVMQYIKRNSSASTPNMVLLPFNIGNPESAVDLYSNLDPRLFALHIDSKIFPELHKYDCLSSSYPVFFVTRDDQRVGMDKYFTLAKSFKNPYSNYSVNIYILKQNCVGNTTSISDVYQPAIMRIHEIRTGMLY